MSIYLKECTVLMKCYIIYITIESENQKNYQLEIFGIHLFTCINLYATINKIKKCIGK